MTCPFCGGTTGFTQRFKVDYNQWISWAGKPIDADQSGDGWEAKIGECLDCRKRFNIEKHFGDEGWFG